jgi:hypothetical protein
VSCFLASLRMVGYMTPEFRVFRFRARSRIPCLRSLRRSPQAAPLPRSWFPKLVEFAIGGLSALSQKGWWRRNLNGFRI